MVLLILFLINVVPKSHCSKFNNLLTMSYTFFPHCLMYFHFPVVVFLFFFPGFLFLGHMVQKVSFKQEQMDSLNLAFILKNRATARLSSTSESICVFQGKFTWADSLDNAVHTQR